MMCPHNQLLGIDSVFLKGGPQNQKLFSTFFKYLKIYKSTHSKILFRKWIDVDIK